MLKEYMARFRKNQDKYGGFVSNEWKVRAYYDFSQEATTPEMKDKVSEILGILDSGPISQALKGEGYQYLGKRFFAHRFRMIDESSKVDVGIRASTKKARLYLEMTAVTSDSTISEFDGLESCLEGLNEEVLSAMKPEIIDDLRI